MCIFCICIYKCVCICCMCYIPLPLSKHEFLQPCCIFWGPWILTQWLPLGHAGPTRTRQPQYSPHASLGTLLSSRASCLCHILHCKHDICHTR